MSLVPLRFLERLVLNHVQLSTFELDSPSMIISKQNKRTIYENLFKGTKIAAQSVVGLKC